MAQSAVITPETDDTRVNRTWTKLRSALAGAGGPLIGLILLCIALSIASPYFLTLRNILNIVDQVTILGVMAVGMTLVLIIGGIDLSVASVLALSMMVTGWTFSELGWPMWLGVLAGLAVGALCGLLNGLGVTYAKLPPFIATLAMLSIARGVANMITDGQQITGFPDAFTALASQRLFGFFTVAGIVLVLLLIVTALFLRYRSTGRAIYAIGGAEEVARLAGIRVRRVTIGVYVFMGLLAGLAGIIMTARLNSAQPGAATGFELDVIAAVVIGGASLNGGVGRITGTLVGVLMIGVLRNGLNLLGVSPFLQQVVIGVVIALAVMLDVLRRRAR